MAHISKWWRKSHTKSAELDRKTLTFLQHRANLMTVSITVILGIWGSTTHHVEFIVGMLAVGAFSYFVGLTLAAACSVICTAASLFHAGSVDQMITLTVVQLVGYATVTWLGYAHKEQQHWQKVMTSKPEHQDQVLPWAFVNDVRTSLAAARFLLFPLHEDQLNQELIKVSNELARLENMFSEMEHDRKHA